MSCYLSTNSITALQASIRRFRNHILIEDHILANSTKKAPRRKNIKTIDNIHNTEEKKVYI